MIVFEKITTEYKINFINYCCEKMNEILKEDCLDRPDILVGQLSIAFMTKTGVIYRAISHCPFCGNIIEIENAKKTYK